MITVELIPGNFELYSSDKVSPTFLSPTCADGLDGQILKISIAEPPQLLGHDDAFTESFCHTLEREFCHGVR